MTTRRQLLKAIPAMTAALAIPGHTLAATEIPAMTKQARSELTPDQALELLRDGNERFVSGKMLQRDLMAQVKATATGQF
ncbi:MAG: carbonic anhydrase, partial [Candidatus Competibacteraceae bacterium]|nr:carbonic anhydrase [Candidatus Competibacteraceae bacterium]